MLQLFECDTFPLQPLVAEFWSFRAIYKAFWSLRFRLFGEN